ncbi:glycogen debranching N-terminal domain-containing protein [Micromonospora chersina]|uniref:amylo-alpha-1,6-glucosidase n=1 Tax=Micromonospora chersina TaxID=47854 RepID=UPI0037A76F69
MKERVSILDGNNFLVSSSTGDVDPDPKFPTGLFSYDTRFLSTWQLMIDGGRLHELSVDDVQYFEARFFLVPGEPTHYTDARTSVIRHRTIGAAFDEHLTVLNHDDRPVDLTLRVEMASDFADLFEIKDPQGKKGRTSAEVSHDELLLRYRRDLYQRETVIRSSTRGAIDRRGMTFDIRVPPHGEWETHFRVDMRIIGAKGRDFRESLAAAGSRTTQQVRSELNSWMASAPRLVCDYEPLVLAYRRSLIDLAALRFTSTVGGLQTVAAGLPWFMTMFGRDSILTCLQILPFLPQLVAPTIRLLATNQAVRLDDFRDAEPGKILHEARYGESAGFEEQPHSPYFGAADSTPLFLILLDEYEQWTGDIQTVKEVEPFARAALAWMDTYADLLGTGYIWYQTRNEETGLVNQCWKDSHDSISYHDGRMPDFPRAVCEQQGYAYDAKIRAARLARSFWNDPAYADRLEREAEDLKERFNRDFWIEDRRFYALALDPDGRPVDALSSNIGHLLWSGIVTTDRAPLIAEHLMGPGLFSGWGIRTLATTEKRFNPIGYHVGTVWPFDNSIAAWGLWRYGYRAEAAIIAKAIIDASHCFDGRLPEAFAGYNRGQTKFPVQYPTACSPQAWSAGTTPLLIRIMLGLQPDHDRLKTDPHVHPEIGSLGLLGIPGRWGRADVQPAAQPLT